MSNLNYIPASEAAKVAGVTTETIRNLCKAGMLSYEMHGTHFYPSREDVEHYAQTIKEVHQIEHSIDDYKSELLAAEQEVKEQLEFMKRAPQQIESLRQFFNVTIERLFRDHEMPLTPRECDIVYGILIGKSFKEVGEEMHLTPIRVGQIWEKALRKWSYYPSLLKNKDMEIAQLKEKINLLLLGPASSVSPVVSSHLLATPLANCDFSVRTVNCLKEAGIETVADLVKYHRADLLKFRSFGKKDLIELDEWLEAHGLSFRMDI